VVGLATARQWAGERQGVDVAERGSYGLRPLAVLAGSAHASVLKAMSILGMGRQVLTPVATLPGRQAVDAHAMGSALRALGGAPAIVVASAGDVNTGDFDDLAALADLCEAHGAWLHVDGAFGLFAACDPARAGWLAGLDRADSVATDAHKWLNVPYDAGVVFTRHLALQEKVFRAVAAYLGAGPDLLHRTPENSRRFRALPSWMTLMAYGRDGCTAVVQQCCALASDLGDRIQRSAHLELLAPVRLNIVCFALRRGGSAERDRLLATLLDGGVVRLTPTVLHGRPALRAAFSNWRTTPADVDRIWAALERTAAERPS
jgi:glutamate/tyrosine decarboxylase-like PLP-dependent enzyme